MLETYLSGAEGLCLLSGLLFAAGFMLLMTEAVSPGLGAGGVVGTLCQLACFLPDVIAGSETGLGLGLAVVGCIFLLLDSYVAGLGALGWIGLVLLLIALWQNAQGAAQFFYTLAAAAVLTAGAMPIALHKLPQSRAIKKIELEETLETGSAVLQRELPSVGTQAVVFSDLRPGGVVCVEEERYLASASTYIEKGAAVRVVRIEGSHLIVERIE